jgi:hypothetical protein
MTTSPALTLQQLSDTVRSEPRAEPIFTDAVPDFTAPPRMIELVELILKQPTSLEVLVHDARWQAVLVPRLLGIAIGGFALFGVALALVLNAAHVWPQWTPLAEFVRDRGGALVDFAALDDSWSVWWNGSAALMTGAYVFGLIAASGVCLPSLYFYGLLSGIKPTMLDVVMQTLKSKAVSAVGLVGILPIYAAVALGVVIFDLPLTLERGVLWLGFILPFLAGLYGVRSLYFGFMRLTATLPVTCRDNRTCFLRRLVLSWAAIYSVVTPVMIYTVWEALQR